jgi:hypothetical protein
MTTREKLIYSKTAASRMLNCLPHQVSIEVWDKIVLAKAKGRRPRFISKRAFQQHFVDIRKQKAVDVTLYQQSATEWLAQSPDSKTYHNIEISNHRITCTCEDYRNQQQILGNACCKHIYSLLLQNGFNSLRDFQSREAA